MTNNWFLFGARNETFIESQSPFNLRQPSGVDESTKKREQILRDQLLGEEAET